MPKPNLKCRDLFDHVQSMMKTKQETNKVDCTSAIYIENETQLPCVIRPSVVYDKNLIGQWRNQSIGLVYAKI